MRILALVLVYGVVGCQEGQSDDQSIGKFMDYLKDKSLGDEYLYDLMSKGPLRGYYKMSFYWKLHEKLKVAYPNFVSESTSYGKSWMENEVSGFVLGKGELEK